jgi:hypothetical protein
MGKWRTFFSIDQPNQRGKSCPRAQSSYQRTGEARIGGVCANRGQRW